MIGPRCARCLSTDRMLESVSHTLEVVVVFGKPASTYHLEEKPNHSLGATRNDIVRAEVSTYAWSQTGYLSFMK